MDKAGGVKHDTGKAPIHLIPYEAIEMIAMALGYGAKKYGEYNFRKGILWSRIFSAMMRHAWAFWRGEDNDPESGLPHLAHLGACVVMLISMVVNRKDLDDRYRGDL